jgi:hypothetical protein
VRALLASLVILASGLATAAQIPLGPVATELNAHMAVQALDRYLETWNSRDPRVWATSLHFPHIRPGPGAFELAATPEQYAAGIDFNATLATGWHHSEWTARRVVHVGPDKVHVAGSWMRYTQDDRQLTGSDITYIVTRQRERWGVLSRFAAGPTGPGGSAAEGNRKAAQAAVETYFRAFSGRKPEPLAETLHFPHVRIADGAVEVWRTAAEYLAGSEIARQRTWFETRIDQLDAVQVSANGANLAVVYSRRDRKGQVLSAYEAIVLVVSRQGQWKVQAISTMGT